MLFLILSILCSVTVGVVFKLSRRFETNSFQIVLTNYAVALLFAGLFFEPNFNTINSDAPLFLYGVIGLLLPIVFILLFRSINAIGIAKTDAAQRLSLFLPIIASWLLFGEQFTALRVLGISIGFLALFFILTKPTLKSETKFQYPLAVFMGYGIIDILFKKVATHTQIPFSTALSIMFLIALVVMIIVVLFQLFVKKTEFKILSVVFGTIVGLLNFGNIWFYLNAHKEFAHNPSTVFAGMNMGVIFLGSVVGVFLFKEKFSKFNYLGILLALVSIFIIVLTQLM